MKGIILAGGVGTRLGALTRVTNKHLLPVYDRPMIFHAMEKLVDAGITDVLVVTGGEHAGDVARVLGDGSDFGVEHLSCIRQEYEGGSAQALGLGEHFAAGQPVLVLLGDNVFEASLRDAVRRFREVGSGARIFLKEVADPRRFGVAELVGGRVARVMEKPAAPRSSYAVTGIYLYDARVFDIVRTLTPSARGEIEITDVNNRFIEWGELHHEVLQGWWADAGTFEGLFSAAAMVRQQALNGRGAARAPDQPPPGAG
jgi:glucose-1-phosphate thymidylyltransferase